MKILDTADIISQTIKNENKFGIHVDNFLDYRKIEEETVWNSFVEKVKEKDKNNWKNIISAIINAPTIFFFDTQDEMLDFYYDYFHANGNLYGKVIATVYDNNGVMLDGTF